ncbi:MAG: DUF4398 domain-containing protein [Myxococcales bacterium]|nr:DUF4398 domain-containing protein [Myxococcales bacterium]
MVFRSLLLLPLALFSACAPLAAHDRLGELSTILGEAEREEAPKYARYEFTKASLYLEEARAKNGYGDYATAEAYATEGSEYARTALQTAKQRRDLERRRKRNEPVAPAAPTAPVTPPTAPLQPEGTTPPTAPVSPAEVTPPDTTPAPPIEAPPPKKKLLPPGMGGGQ